jgi:hypothetical protein
VLSAGHSLRRPQDMSLFAWVKVDEKGVRVDEKGVRVVKKGLESKRG